MYSTVTGKLAEDIRWDAAHWWRNLRQPVLFAATIPRLLDSGIDTFIEISPHPILSVSIMECLQHDKREAVLVPSLRRNQDEMSSMLTSLSTLYETGGDVEWSRIESPGRHVSLPDYPFDRQAYWIEACDTNQSGAIPVQKQIDSLASALGRTVMTQEDHSEKGGKAVILSRLRSLLGGLLQVNPDDLDVYAPFLEMGADSIILMNALEALQKEFGVKLSIKELFEDCKTIDLLAAHITRVGNPEVLYKSDPTVSAQQSNSTVEEWVSHQHANESAEVKAPESLTIPPSAGGWEPIFSKQLGLLTEQGSIISRAISEQLEAIRSIGRDTSQSSALSSSDQSELQHQNAPQAAKLEIDSCNPMVDAGRSRTQTTPVAMPAGSSSTSLVASYTSIQPGSAGGLNERQQIALNELVERYVAKTAKSKRLAQQYRDVLADSRASAGFRYSIKDLLYLIHAERSSGSRIWDVDGNEYIDLTMGFGINLFGHNPSFIADAWQEQLTRGVPLGPQAVRAGEVARLISEMTGLERVAFCNSGTEAVMMAIRLARTAAERSKIAIFSGSYHGTYDGVLAGAGFNDGGTIPLAPGILRGAVEEVIVLEYGDPQALKTIKQFAGELAAVLVEPIQSRHPDLQPKDFLRQLRKLTDDHGIALIFDEMITGFRLMPGGAQEWFGIQADLATYGKVIGGGMPIGVVAGKAAYMDGIDGGYWEYGDLSYPKAKTTFFAGTFCKHPLTMASAQAVLLHLKREGSQLQQTLNECTQKLASSLNAYFEANEVPMQVVYCGSLFRFQFHRNLDLFFYYLRDKGIFVWEGRNCFISTAHTGNDIDKIKTAVAESVDELRKGGFLPEPAGQKHGALNSAAFDDAQAGSKAKNEVPREHPLLEAQEQFC